MSETSSNTLCPNTERLLPNQVFKKLTLARKKIADLIMSGAIVKTGMSQYNYLELVDFLPITHGIFNEIGLCAVFEFTPEEAILYIHCVDNPEDLIPFQSPVVPAQLAGKAPDPIKSLGATQTYMRRYLWLQALELAVPDNVDAIKSQSQTLESIEL